MPSPVMKTALLALILATAAHACLWDSDTLAAERARFPGIDLVITGSFAAHSREFHEWRVTQRQKDIASPASLPEHYDDLAVSHHKLGDHQAAIDTMLKKEKVSPGLYETYSNLGTFYIYTGELQKALKAIDRALAINPNAHFGREKYQKWLVLWILENPEPSHPPGSFDPIGTHGVHGFANLVVRQEAGGLPISSAQELTLSPKHRDAAIRGVTGMMWFADYDNPLLLEALGDLLISGERHENAAQLACLCYLHAALTAKTPSEKERLTTKCEKSGRATPEFDVKKTQADLQKALKISSIYRETVRQNELKWIAEGLDVSDEYQKKYLVPVAGK